jgi:hypothetical protein
VFIRLGLQTVLKGSLEDMWTLFYTMQIMCYMIYYSIRFPSNSEIYLNEFRGIIEFDILNPEKFVQTFFWDDFSIKELISGVKSKATEVSMFDDLFIFIFAAVAFVVALLLMCLLYLICKKLKDKIIAKLKKIKSVFFFNGLIRSLTVAYIKMCMTNGSQVRRLIRGEELTSGELIPVGGMIIFLFLLPYISFRVAKKYRPRLDEPEIKARISNLTLDIHKFRHPYSIYYHSVFLLRRLSFILVPTLLLNYPYF